MAVQRQTMNLTDDSYYKMTTNTTLNNGTANGEIYTVTKIVNDILVTSQLLITIIGFIANVMTLITLTKQGKGFGDTILTLLKHQSAVDAVVCIFAGIILLSPSHWVPGVIVIDEMLCYLWHGQGMYWVAVYISVYNIVLIAYDRYLCVCKAFKYQSFSRGVLYRLIGLVYFSGVVCNVGCYLQVRIRDDGECYSEHAWDGPSAEWFFLLFGISIFIHYFVIPCVFFIGFYGMVIWTLRKRMKGFAFKNRAPMDPGDGAAGSVGSRKGGKQGRRRNAQLVSQEPVVIDKATVELTKTAFTVTVIFVIALGYDCWYYLLGNLQVIEYVINSPLQKIGVWLSVFNSCANPFVYALFIPRYRKAVSDTFCGKCCKRRKNESETGEGPDTNISNSK